MNTSPKSSLAKLAGLAHNNKNRLVKVLVMGQPSVGKTAMIVRFITKRFIGEYDSNLEKVYTYCTIFDKQNIQFDILDTTSHNDEINALAMENNIRWADAFILVYSVTDKSSFDECNHLKFLINYNKRRRRIGSNNKDTLYDIPVLLVGNKNDQVDDRMVSVADGQRRYRDLNCACFHEISVRESFEDVFAVFRDVYRFWRVYGKFPKLKRSTSDVQRASDVALSPDSGCSFYDPSSLSHEARCSFFVMGSTCLEECSDHTESTDELGTGSFGSYSSDMGSPFRGRASTDGTLLSRPRRWRYPPPGCSLPHTNRVERRMSISTRGSNASY